jgi:enamine deaminase RidA (YjgF/YER057c/UK114 family)
MNFKIINPERLGMPRGYANGLLAETGGRPLFISGQVGWNEHQQIVSDDFVEQFDRALSNLLLVVNEAGGKSSDVVRLIMYVTDIDEYRGRTKEIGERYSKHMSKHFPAMVLVEVKGLVDPAAKIEIEGMALIQS